MNRTYRLIILMAMLVSLFVISGCSGETANGSTDAAAEVEVRAEKVTHIEVLPLVLTDVQERFTLPGSLKAWEDLTLAAEVAGPVTWIGPQEGSRLTRSTAILTIDPETRQANYDRDKVEAELKKKRMERLQSLVEQSLVSQQEYEDAINAYERARVALRLSELQLEKSTLKMPIDGVLDDLLVDRSEYVKVGDPIAVVVQIDRLKVEVDVPEKDIAYLNPGDQIHVVQANIGRGVGIERDGKLVHLAYKADPVTRTYRALIEIDNQDRRLRPGMIVRIEAVRRELPQVIAIPLYALVERDGKKVVFVEQEKKAVQRDVEVEAILGDRVVIRSGLQAGEKLIIKGQQLIADGTRVASGVK
jgi:membrane fusion protein (multidrug efflux system)